MDVKFNKDGPVTFGALGGTYPQMNARAGDFAVVSGIVRNGVLGPAIGDVVRPDNAASVTITMGGVTYTADSGVLGDPFHLVGPVVNEYHKAVPLTNHLTARWVIRKYVGFDQPRVDLTIENNWAYEPGPQNFTYDVSVSIGGVVVYTQAELTHLHHARWRMLFNDFGATADFPWLGTNLVPNYEKSVVMDDHVLASMLIASKPMSIGLATAYMPTTGAHNDIGILPAWAAAYFVSRDERARAGTLATADGAGSWSIHYRDKNTDLPVSLKDFPYMTIVGNHGDAFNPVTKLYEAFPAPGGDIITPYSHDLAHQPDLAYSAYLIKGDYYYLEELQFWAMYDVFSSNPSYRGNSQGIVQSEQVRGQAWALRTLAHAAFITPDAHALKDDLAGFLSNNLDWYNATYSNNTAANKFGAIENGAAYSYNNATAIAPWQDDFFTSVIGHIAELGFDKAKPLLMWKAQFPVGRMTAPGVCFITGAAYNLTLKETSTAPLFDTFAQAYTHDLGPDFMALTCGGIDMASQWGRITNLPTYPNDMGQLSSYVMGYPSNMQPALAYSVDSGAPNAKTAWNLFKSRRVQPDYSQGVQFAIEPRDYVAQPVPAIIDPAAIEQWQQIATEGQTITLPEDTQVRYGAGQQWWKAIVSGSVIVNNSTFGYDPAPNVAKVLQQLLPQPPEGNPMTTFTVNVTLETGTVQLPSGSEAAPTSTLVEILDSDKSTALAKTATAPYSVSGITPGNRFVRTTDYDSKGQAMGDPIYTPFTIVDTTPPPMVNATVTTGVSITYAPDA